MLSVMFKHVTYNKNNMNYSLGEELDTLLDEISFDDISTLVSDIDLYRVSVMPIVSFNENEVSPSIFTLPFIVGCILGVSILAFTIYLSYSGGAGFLNKSDSSINSISSIDNSDIIIIRPEVSSIISNLRQLYRESITINPDSTLFMENASEIVGVNNIIRELAFSRISNPNNLTYSELIESVIYNPMISPNSSIPAIEHMLCEIDRYGDIVPVIQSISEELLNLGIW